MRLATTNNRCKDKLERALGNTNREIAPDQNPGKRTG